MKGACGIKGNTSVTMSHLFHKTKDNQELQGCYITFNRMTHLSHTKTTHNDSLS